MLTKFKSVKVEISSVMKTVKVYKEDWKLLKRLKDNGDKRKVADVIANLLKEHENSNKKAKNNGK